MTTASRETTILGAGPAGLSAAITLATAGHPVTVYERNEDCGMRFRGDYQAFENWSSPTDILTTLQDMGLAINFWHRPITHASFYDYKRRRRDITFEKPALYLIKRGRVPGSLDTSLKAQAIQRGARLVFNKKITEDQADIIAGGPSRADGIVRGITFETTFVQDPVMILDNTLAPKTFAYLLIADGRGCLGTGLTSHFETADKYLDRTIQVFTELYNFDITNPKRYSGYGTFALRASYEDHGKKFVGEAAGLQDYLFAFGLRQAIISGHLAARSIMDDTSYDMLVAQTLVPQLKISLINRFFFSLLGNRGYSRALERGRKIDAPLRQMNTLYNPRPVHHVLLPLARLAYKK